MIVSDFLKPLKDLGGLIILKNSIFTGTEQEFNFIHFSFHEYFTAKYIISLVSHNDNKPFKQNLINEIGKIDRIFHFKKILEFIKQIKKEIYLEIINVKKEMIPILEKVDDKIIQVLHENEHHTLKLDNISVSSIMQDLIFKVFIHQLQNIAFENVFFYFNLFITIMKKYQDNHIKCLKFKYSEKHPVMRNAL